MEFILKEYGPGIQGIKFTTLPNKPCVLNNVNGTVSESDFYPLDKDYEGETITYGPKLKCMNVDKLELLGNYDTAEAKTLMVAFVKCDSKLRNDCKTEEEIHEWLTFRYIIRLQNTKRFLSNEFGVLKTEASSKIKWEAISKDSRTERPQLITRNKAIFKDSLLQVNFDDLSTEEDTGFIF